MKVGKTVFGQTIAPVTLTPIGAALLAITVALPVGCVLWIVEWLWL